MFIQPYLFFDGRCEEAVEFYRQALGATVEMMMRFKDSPSPPDRGMCAPGSEDKIMHACFHVGDSAIMASDGRCQGKPKFEGVSLSISTSTPDEAERLFAALSEDGQVQMPMETTFFSPRFGMVADKFGVSWMVLVAK